MSLFVKTVITTVKRDYHTCLGHTKMDVGYVMAACPEKDAAVKAWRLGIWRQLTLTNASPFFSKLNEDFSTLQNAQISTCMHICMH